MVRLSCEYDPNRFNRILEYWKSSKKNSNISFNHMSYYMHIGRHFYYTVYSFLSKAWQRVLDFHEWTQADVPGMCGQSSLSLILTTEVIRALSLTQGSQTPVAFAILSGGYIIHKSSI